MRRVQRQTLRRRDASYGFNARWLRRWGEVRVHWTGGGSPRALAALAVLGGILVLVAGSGAGWANQQTSTATQPKPPLRPAVGRSRISSAFPAVLWRDTIDGTTYSASFKTDIDGYSAFAFTTPLGEQIQGTLPLLTLADGSYGQSTGTKPGATILPTVVTTCYRGTLQSDSSNQQPIWFIFQSHISQDRLAAYATFSYISVLDQPDYPLLCLKGSTQGAAITTYQLQAACAMDSCPDLTAAAGPTVDKYDTAVLAAEQKGSAANWRAVYQLTCQQITAQYPLAEFVSYLNQQVESVGQITQMSEPLYPPVPEYTPEGQAYFEIQQTVTVVRHGSSSTRTLISYYLLENGAWRFWFSD